jgi:hypothetical protein
MSGVLDTVVRFLAYLKDPAVMAAAPTSGAWYLRWRSLRP